MKRLSVIIFNFFLLAVSSTLVWGAAEKAEALDKKIGNLDKLSGLNYFFASWYNDNMWLYAIIVTVIDGRDRLAHRPGHRHHLEDDRHGSPQDGAPRITPRGEELRNA